jgi:hypothetical protein
MLNDMYRRLSSLRFLALANDKSRLDSLLYMACLSNQPC